MIKLAFFFALAGTVAFADAFQNGSFEDPHLVLSPDFSAVPTGWVKADPSCTGTNCAGIGLFIQNYATFGLPTLNGSGVQAFGFGGNGVISGNLSQTFDTVAGSNYQVSFQYVVQQGFEFEDLQVDALDGATVLATNSIRFNNRDWVTTTLNFVATGTSTALRFSDMTGAVDPGTGFGTNWALDAVTVNGVGGGSAVPEPSSLALVGLGGLGALGLRLRKSRRS